MLLAMFARFARRGVELRLQVGELRFELRHVFERRRLRIEVRGGEPPDRVAQLDARPLAAALEDAHLVARLRDADRRARRRRVGAEVHAHLAAHPGLLTRRRRRWRGRRGRLRRRRSLRCVGLGRRRRCGFGCRCGLGRLGLRLGARRIFLSPARRRRDAECDRHGSDRERSRESAPRRATDALHELPPCVGASGPHRPGVYPQLPAAKPRRATCGSESACAAPSRLHPQPCRRPRPLRVPGRRFPRRVRRR